MTPRARQNLGGLFNGSTPPDRFSSVADALGPRLITGLPVVEPGDDSTPAEPQHASAAHSPAAPSRGNGAARQHITNGQERGTHPPTSQERQWTALEWIDPVKAIEHYFAWLRAVLDANREFAVGWASAAMAMPQHGGIGDS